MVVVTIIGILAAVAVPRVFAFIRTSSTAEVSQNGAAITAGISGYAQSQLQTAAATQSLISGTFSTPDLSSSNEISAIIPQIQLPLDSKFNYAISAVVATAGPDSGDVVFCMIATGRSNAAVPGGQVLYSSVPSSAPGWDGSINRFAYVNGLTTLAGVQAGGYCSATGVAQTTCTSC
jgi:type II secretory pathway pseudopilin PulG